MARRLQLPVGLGFGPRRGRSRVSTIAVVGGGPAGPMAAAVARAAGVDVDVFDAKGSVGRRLLIDGTGGLNPHHPEPLTLFDPRYREPEGENACWLGDISADAPREGV